MRAQLYTLYDRNGPAMWSDARRTARGHDSASVPLTHGTRRRSAMTALGRGCVKIIEVYWRSAFSGTYVRAIR